MAGLALSYLPYEGMRVPYEGRSSTAATTRASSAKGSLASNSKAWSLRDSYLADRQSCRMFNQEAALLMSMAMLLKVQKRWK